MIKINLLPLDKRKTERTPLKGAGLMIADAAVFVVVAILVVISLIQIGNVNTEIEAKKKTLASLQGDVKRWEVLTAEVAVLDRDAKDLEQVTAMRPFEWSEVFDKIWDAADKHKRLWCDGWEIADGKQMESKVKALDPKTTVTSCKYGIVLKCHVGGLDVKAMTAFRKELKEEPTLAKLFPIINFDIQFAVMEQKEFAEKFSIDFEVILINTGQTKQAPVGTPARRTAP
jgi:hypothetical protein